jgi:hypothetical protein
MVGRHRAGAHADHPPVAESGQDRQGGEIGHMDIGLPGMSLQRRHQQRHLGHQADRQGRATAEAVRQAPPHHGPGHGDAKAADA